MRTYVGPIVLWISSQSVGNSLSVEMIGYRFLYLEYPRSYYKKMKDFTVFDLETSTELRDLSYVGVRLVTLRRTRSLSLCVDVMWHFLAYEIIYTSRYPASIAEEGDASIRLQDWGKSRSLRAFGPLWHDFGRHKRLYIFTWLWATLKGICVFAVQNVPTHPRLIWNHVYTLVPP